MKIVQGDITETEHKYILQQCDCVSLHPNGLGEILEKKFPNTSPYNFRQRADFGFSQISSYETRSCPGTVYILSSENSPNIVSLFSQYYPGMSENLWALRADLEMFNSVKDKPNDREKYFEKCLDGLFDFFEFSSDKITIAVPYNIGCESGGDWKTYQKMLLDFEKRMIDNDINLEMTMYI
jgi:hypothetical protein